MTLENANNSNSESLPKETTDLFGSAHRFHKYLDTIGAPLNASSFLEQNQHETYPWLKRGLPISLIGCRIVVGSVNGAMISMQEGTCIASGNECWNRGGVLYLSAKEDMDALSRRFRQIKSNRIQDEDNLQAVSDNFHIWSLYQQWPDLSVTENGKSLLAEAIKHQVSQLKFHKDDKLNLIVFDDLFHFTNGGASDDKKIANAIFAMKDIAKSLNCSCIFLHYVTDAKACSPVITSNVPYQERLTIIDKRTARDKAVKQENGDEKYISDYEILNYVEWSVTKQDYDEHFWEKHLERQPNGTFEEVDLRTKREVLY